MCLSSISPKQKTLGHLILKYSTRKSEVTVGNGLEDFFENIETDKCALTNCIIRNEGCGPRYSGTNIKMASDRPWSISARVD